MGTVSEGGLEGISLPVQSPLDKIPLLPSIPFVEPASNVGASIRIGLTCHNPNPISALVHQALGTVYVGSERIELGTIEVQNAVMPAYSNGTIPTEDSVVLDSALKDLLPQLVLGGVPMQFVLATTATFSLFGASETLTIRIRCGMMLAGAVSKILDPDEPLMGPMACSTADDLKIPPVDAQNENQFKKYIVLAERVKNVVAISCMLLGFILGSLFVFCAILSQGCCRRQQIQEVALPGFDDQRAKVPAWTSEPEENV